MHYFKLLRFKGINKLILSKESNELYNKYLEFASEILPDFKDITIKAQRNWIKERNKITDIQNLKQVAI